MDLYAQQKCVNILIIHIFGPQIYPSFLNIFQYDKQKVTFQCALNK